MTTLVINFTRSNIADKYFIQMPKRAFLQLKNWLMWKKN